MFQKFTPAPSVRPILNIGCLFDITTGHYVTGKHGESILIGGLAPLTGIGGRGNMYKSTIAHFMLLSALDRYVQANAQVFDTEMSLTMMRMHQLAARLPSIGGKDLEELQRLMITDSTVYKGEAWFNLLKEMLEEKIKDPKANRGVMPCLDRDGKNMEAWLPSIVEVDSLSQFQTSSMEKIQDDAEVGSSGRNILALRSSMAKNQMLEEMPGLTGRTGAYMILTAHMGDDLALDPYAPPAKKLSFLKNKVKFKRVPENYTFLMNNCWYCYHAEPMINQTTKAPEFPRDSDDDMKGDTDLMKVSLLQLRGKSGPTGLPIEILVSQSEGVLRSLTEFNYIKTMGRFGIGGNDRNYFLDLVPDVSLSRTTVRGKINDNPHLQRALEITSELCQITSLWHEFDDSLLCTPAELYEQIKAKGYDWSMILETRGFWIFEGSNDPRRFLSTKDILRMAKGKYVPYWLTAEEKSKLKLS